MPERTEYAPGTPSWIDLTTTDVDAAKAFYGDVFGWTYHDAPAGESVYSMCLMNGKPVAGIFPQPPEQAQQGIPPMWNVYVTVADVVEALATTEAAGGTVLMQPMDVMEAGKMAVVQDPSGGAICLWEPVKEIGAHLVNEHGALTWTELMTGDQEAAASFYGKLFGWDAGDMSTPDGSVAKIFQVDGRPLASSRGLPQEGVPPHWLTYFAVNDADAATAAVRSGGGQVLMEPFDTPPGRMALAMDPAGAAFAYIQIDPDFDPTAG